MPVTVLAENSESTVDATVEGGDLWLAKDGLEASTGWVLKAEGLCRGDACVTLPPDGTGIVRDGQVNASAAWRRMGAPVVSTDDGRHWYLGESGPARAAHLESLEAPDFTLPDLSGRLHSLSEHRGKKVFLATWASW